MKLGDKVKCHAYIKSSKNHYEIISGKQTENGSPCCYYWTDNATEGIEVEVYHECERYKNVDKEFSGIYVGTTYRGTKLHAEYYDDYYCGDGYQIRIIEPQGFAVVYYADNKKRLVPIDKIEED